MHTFAQKQKPKQKENSTNCTRPSRTFSGQVHEVNSVLHLQRTIGNQAVQRFLQANSEEREDSSLTGTSSHFSHDFSQIPVHAKAYTNIQPSLTVGVPNDKYEQEADRIADRVMRTPNLQSLERTITTHTPKPDIHRRCTDCEDELQRQAEEEEEKEEEEELIQPKTAGGESTRTPAFEGGVRAIQGAGSPLPDATRSFFESRFGSGFSNVRIHADTNAGNLARQVNAKAFTLGRDLVFGAGLYSPETTEGKHLLAHELTHVVQQRGTESNSNTKLLDRETKGSENRVRILTPTPLLHVNAGFSRIQRDPDPPTREQSERVAWRFHAMAASASSVAQFQASVEAAAATAFGAIGADALVFSISGAGGYWGGVGGGYEMVYSPRFGWATYFQLGVGVSTPGGSVAFEVGVIWNMGNPRDYRGSFIELAGSYSHFSGSAFISPSSSPTGGIKVGGAIGSNGVSLLYEYYWQLSGITALPDIVHRGHYTFHLSQMNLCGRSETFVVQFNTEDVATNLIRVKVLYQRINRREESTFNLNSGETLNPILLDEGEHMALFDVDGDHVSDMRIVIPSYIQVRGNPGLNIELLFRGRHLRRLSYPGVPIGMLRTGRQYFRIPGTEVRPSGPLYIDECSMVVNDRDR